MNQEDVTMWYEDEKQRIFDKFVEELEKTKNKKKTEEKFHKDMENLSKKFNSKMNSALKSEERMRKLKAFVKRVKQKYHIEDKNEKKN